MSLNQSSVLKDSEAFESKMASLSTNAWVNHSSGSPCEEQPSVALIRFPFLVKDTHRTACFPKSNSRQGVILAPILLNLNKK